MGTIMRPRTKGLIVFAVGILMWVITAAYGAYSFFHLPESRRAAALHLMAWTRGAMLFASVFFGAMVWMVLKSEERRKMAGTKAH